MGIKKWLISKPDKAKAAELSDQYGYPSFLALLLVTRGINTKQKIDEYLSDEAWEDPFLLRDMDKAVARLEQALDSSELVVIYGDYDADGVTATALLYSYLESVGCNVRYYIPTREGDGYGMNCQAIDKIAEQGGKLIVTVDNGISSAEEIAYARTLGIDTIVTDHHTPPEKLPAEAVAVVNPHQAECGSHFKELCGVGVALKLVTAMEHSPEELDELWEHFADLAAIGTVGDIVPLMGENRLLVKKGLQAMAECDRMGLRLLMESAALNAKEALSAGNLSFTLVPRINAMGRMGSSERVVRLFLTDYEEEARQLVGETEQENRERQRLEQEILTAAGEILKKEPRRLMDRVLVVWGEKWHPGVLGIVASRLTEKFGKPSVVISVDGDEATGSCRSLPGFSMINAIASCAHLLTRFGGHTQAAGCSLPSQNVEQLRQELNTCAAASGEEMPVPTLNIDCKLNPAGITPELTEQLKQMEPFGAGNPMPVFALMKMRLDAIVPVGGGKHLRLNFSRDGNPVRAMLFRTTPQEFAYKIGEELDIAVTLEKNTYRGESTVSVYIKDIHPAGLDVDSLFAEKQRYERYARGELAPEEQKALLPDRRQLAAIYRVFRSEQQVPRPVEYWCSRLAAEQVGYDKLMTGLIAMRQMKLLSLHREADVITVSLAEAAGKVQLEDAPILRKLRQACGE